MQKQKIGPSVIIYFPVLSLVATCFMSFDSGGFVLPLMVMERLGLGGEAAILFQAPHNEKYNAMKPCTCDKLS